jgi:hypothetical protein
MPEHYILNKGPAGPQGSRGEKGIRGEKGLMGADANPTVIRYVFSNVLPASLPSDGYIPVNWEGTGMPSANIGVKSGESVVYAADNSLWTYLPGSGGNHWKQATILSGDVKGTPGQKGEHGDKGVNGEKGDKGTEGLQGIQGLRGLKGEKGQIGVAGPTGLQGQKGPAGVDGTNGTKGTAGDAGLNGANGTPGLKGQKGESGEDGIDGPKGDIGPSGVDGVSPSPIQLPKFMCSYNGRDEIVTAHYNLDRVKKLGVGYYRFRFAQKLYAQRGIVLATAYSDPTLEYENHRFVTVIGQTDWTVTVKVEDPRAEQRADAYVSIVLYLPN